MRTFEHFPENKICSLCGTNEDRPCTLIPIDGTNKENICEAIPTHVDCITKSDFRFNKQLNIVYKHVL